MGLMGLAEIVKTAGTAMAVWSTYDFQHGYAHQISTKTPPMG